MKARHVSAGSRWKTTESRRDGTPGIFRAKLPWSMGIGFVLFFWAIAGTIAAGIGSLIFGAIAAFLTKGATGSRKRAIILASTFPFVCLGWAGVLFIFQAIVNGAILHRDPGLGDTWECPLPNGYAITMIDVTNQGWVYNPKTQGDGSIFEKEDAIGAVRTVQVAGRYILGASDSHAASSFGKPTTDPDLYFLIDTQTGKRSNFANSQELGLAASQLGIRLKSRRD
jgi:hypothetical protein